MVSTIIIICLLTACNQKSQDRAFELSPFQKLQENKREYTSTFFALDTVITITFYEGGSEELLKLCEEKIQHYEQLFSRTIPTSDIAKLNAARGEWTEVSEDTINVLKIAQYYCNLSEGALDVTIATAKDYWDFTGASDFVPDTETLAKACKHVNFENIEIDGPKVRLLDRDASIDLGCIAKGYIADQLRNALIELDVKSALLNLGGNVICIGQKPDGAAFCIGIQKPFAATGVYETTVELREATEEMAPNYITAVTSGIYERCFKKDGVLYHHILDPKTGYPVETDLASVTVIGDSGSTCDALSTACLALGYEKGKQLIASMYGIKAIFIKTSGEVEEIYGLPDA